MEKAALILGIILFTLSSCSIANDDNDDSKEITINEWNLINVTGGISGENYNFEIGEIVWLFDDLNAVLTITNTNIEDLEDGLDSGNYNLNILKNNEDLLFLFIDTQEFGEINFFGTDNDDMTIDQNSLTNGQGSDGFVYTFKRTTRVIQF